MKFALPLLLALAAVPLHAGLWDRDRPKDDALPSVLDVITGRYDEYPASYYQSRGQRLAGVLDKLPDPAPGAELTAEQVSQIAEALPVMDDLAVALFRQGEFARAIILLDRKNRLSETIRADRTATAKQQSYRATANKAACLAARARLTPGTPDLQDARDLLAAVVKEDPYNSDAQWSLVELDWLLSGPAYVAGIDPLFPNLLGLSEASFRGERNEAALARNNVSGCIAYLTRRIAYEGAESADLMYALSLALALSGRNEEAVLAWLKLCEMIDNGAASAVADAPAARGLKRLMGVHLGAIYERDAAEKLYSELRSQAEGWRNSRLKYLEQKLQAGKHPDTEPAFWAGWSPTQPGVPAPGKPKPETNTGISTTLLIGGIAGLVLVLCVLMVFTVLLGRNKASHPSVDEI